jgi:uncharacterized protein YjeT (DUF2065 family)
MVPRPRAGALAVFGEIMRIAAGIVLILMGAVYVRWPNVFRRWFWMRTSVAIRSMSEDGYRKYMRTLGGVIIAAGIAVIALAVVR